MSILSNVPILNRIADNDNDLTEEEQRKKEMIENASGDGDIHLPSDGISLVPEEMQIYRDKIVADGTYFRTFAVDDWPPTLQQDTFKGILKSAKLDFDTSLHLSPYETQDAIDKLETLESKLGDKRSGDFARFTANKESMKRTEQTLSTIKQLITDGEKLFDVTFYITIRTESEDALERRSAELKNKLTREAQLGLSQCKYQQKKALLSNSPASINELAEDNDGFKQIMPAKSIAKMFPFMEDSFMEESGVLYGINENSMTPVFVDIFARANGYNQLTTGMIGSGKSFSTSEVMLEMERAYPDLQQFIIDPMGGFLGVNNCLDGDRIIIGGDEPINPLEIKETPDHVMEKSQGKLDPWSMKKQELRWFFTQFFYDADNEEGLNSHEKGMLDQAITMTYNAKGITQDIETHSKESPTILDLIDVLENIAEDAEEFSDTNLDEEADKQREIALNLLLRMKPFKEGGEYHNLAQPTEIDVESNDTIYLDLQQIPEHSDSLGIMMQLLFMKIYQNSKSVNAPVAITIDEAHKIMGDEEITGGLEELFRHSRHFDISINLISQTPEEFYVNATAENIAKQCTIKRFHRVDSLDEDIAKDKLELNDREIDFIESAEMGEGEKDYSEALLTIQDADRSIPLRIEATEEEALVIDYDPTESLKDFDTKKGQQMKQALDMYNENDDPIFVGEQDDLAQEIKSQITSKRRKRRQTIAEEDPSLLTQEERQAIENSPGGPNNISEGLPDADNENASTGVQAQSNGESPEEEATAENYLLRNITPSQVREYSDEDLERIANIKDIDADNRKELENNIIEEFFGTDSESENGTGVTNTDSGSITDDVDMDELKNDLDDISEGVANNDSEVENGATSDDQQTPQDDSSESSDMWGEMNGDVDTKSDKPEQEASD